MSNEGRIVTWILALFNIFFLGYMLTVNATIDGPIYERITITDKVASSKSFYRNKVNVAVDGTWVEYTNKSTNTKGTMFIENPFVARSYIIGNTYIDENNIIKGFGVGDVVGLIGLSVVLSIIVLVLFLGFRGEI